MSSHTQAGSSNLSHRSGSHDLTPRSEHHSYSRSSDHDGHSHSSHSSEHSHSHSHFHEADHPSHSHPHSSDHHPTDRPSHPHSHSSRTGDSYSSPHALREVPKKKNSTGDKINVCASVSLFEFEWRAGLGMEGEANVCSILLAIRPRLILSS